MFLGDYVVKKKLYIILSIILFSVIVTYVDAVIKPDYFIKILVKIFFFLALPILYFIINREEADDFKKLFIFKKEGLLKAFLLAFIVYISIVGGYFITRGVIDYSHVTTNLVGSMGITKDKFIYVTLYLALINSFLEEFFFRGLGFITLKKYTGRTFAYIFTSIFFAIYHAGMMIGSFDLFTYILMLIGLFIGGCLFSFINEKSNTIYHSWFVHMFTNFAINTVGFILFNL